MSTRPNEAELIEGLPVRGPGIEDVEKVRYFGSEAILVTGLSSLPRGGNRQVLRTQSGVGEVFVIADTDQVPDDKVEAVVAEVIERVERD